MTKYNLIEDTYGDNWAKTSADKYLDSSFCIIGITYIGPNNDIRYVKFCNTVHSRPFSGYIFAAGVQIRLFTPFVPECIPCLGKKDLYASFTSMQIRFFFRVLDLLAKGRDPKIFFFLSSFLLFSPIPNRPNLKFFLEKPRDGNPWWRLKTKNVSKSHHRNSVVLDEHSISCWLNILLVSSLIQQWLQSIAIDWN